MATAFSETWTVDQVSAWVESSGFAEYAPLFTENEVDGEALLSLDSEMMKEMGVTKVGPRAKLVRRIENLVHDTGSVTAAGGSGGGGGGSGGSSARSGKGKKKDSNVAASEKHPNAVKCGYLTKEGEKVKNWKRRWFVLEDMVLFYYKNENAKKPKGKVPIPGYEVSFSDKRDNCFQVSHENCRTYYFQADTHEECLEWMRTIRETGLAKAGADWMRHESKFFSVSENEIDGLDVQMEMDEPREAHELRLGVPYRFTCHWIRNNEAREVWLEAAMHDLIVQDVEGAIISRHPYTVIKRYSVDTKHPLFSFLEIRKGEKTVYTFHMGNKAIAMLCNEVTTGHINKLAEIFNARRAAAADASGGDSADPAVEDEKPANKILVQTRRGRRDSTVDQIEASFDPRALPTTGTILEVETPAVLEAEAEAAATTSTATTSGAIALEDDGSDDGGRRLEASESTSSLGVMDSS